MADRKIISIDGMGGDNAPLVVVEGLELFAKRRSDHGTDESPRS